MRIDPARLLLLLEIAEHGSLTRTAERTGRTPSAVSQQVTKLEREVGTQLVERKAHGTSLTQLGSELAQRARDIETALRQAGDLADKYLDEHRGRLRIGAFPSAGLTLLPEVLAALRHRHPHAELSVADLGPYEGIARVAEHELDLALIGTYDEHIDVPGDVELVHLLTDPIHAVIPETHPYATAAATTGTRQLSDFATDAWASAPKTLPNRRQLEARARTEGFTPNVPFESESYAVAEAVVSAGVAVAFIPRLATTRRRGTISVALESPKLRRKIYAVTPSSTQHAPLTSVCLGLLRDLCTDLE